MASAHKSRAQVCPVKPGRQVQLWVPFRWCTQLPLFWQRSAHKSCKTKHDSVTAIKTQSEQHFSCRSVHSLVRENQGPIHTGRGTRRTTRRKQIGPVDVNGGIHTAHKQHQRKNVPICARVASCVLCGWGPSIQSVAEVYCIQNAWCKSVNKTFAQHLHWSGNPTIQHSVTGIDCMKRFVLKRAQRLFGLSAHWS